MEAMLEATVDMDHVSEIMERGSKTISSSILSQEPLGLMDLNELLRHRSLKAINRIRWLTLS
jgi:hypothetical protein